MLFANWILSRRKDTPTDTPRSADVAGCIPPTWWIGVSPSPLIAPGPETEVLASKVAKELLPCPTWACKDWIWLVVSFSLPMISYATSASPVMAVDIFLVPHLRLTNVYSTTCNPSAIVTLELMGSAIMDHENQSAGLTLLRFEISLNDWGW